MFEYRTIRWTRHAAAGTGAGTIGLLTLARPQALNAIDVRMRIELDLILDQIRRDDGIRVVIITGEGKGFCAGGDLRTEAAPLGALDEENDFGEFGAYKELANYIFNDLRHVVIQRAIRKLEALPAVTIAAINGAAVGIGLVERVFPHDRLIEEALGIAERIAAAPFLSVRHAKALVRRYWDHNRSEEGAQAELDAVMEITRTGDCREGIRAFLDKRPPVYRGPVYGG